jgi:hypothetical protein
MGNETVVETSIEDDIRAAMGEVATKDDSTTAERERDDKGKFVAKENETEVEAAARLEPDPKEKGTEVKDPLKDPAVVEDPAKEGEQHLLTEDKAPRGWAPAIREKWGSIPEDIRKEIIRREEASAVGVRQLQEGYAPMEKFVGSIAPFIQEANQNGVAPDQYIGSVLASERILRKADLPTKFQEILRIADQYGVPLRDIINQSVGSEVLTKPNQNQGQAYVPPEVARELQESRQWREQFEDRQIKNELAAFSKDKEFYEDVRERMAVMVESGAVQTLQDAYDEACWATPSVRTVLLQRQGVQKDKSELEKRQEAASSASPKPKGEIEVKGGDKDDDDEDLSDTVRKAFAESASGRI